MATFVLVIGDVFGDEERTAIGGRCYEIARAWVTRQRIKRAECTQLTCIMLRPKRQ